MNPAADAAPTTLRLSMDAKATVHSGPFARGGKSRVPTVAVDHDFQPDVRMTPVGILLPATNELFVYGVTSRVTSDCLVDLLHLWWESVRARFAAITTLVINLDNGPERQSHRTQFLHRIVQFAHQTGLTVKLASYPPYHSKYNPIERCWGALEQHGNGSLLDSLQGALDFIETLTWRGVRPIVAAFTRVYRTGVTLTKAAMKLVEQHVTRDPRLGRWFVTIPPILGPKAEPVPG